MPFRLPERVEYVHTYIMVYYLGKHIAVVRTGMLYSWTSDTGNLHSRYASTSISNTDIAYVSWVLPHILDKLYMPSLVAAKVKANKVRQVPARALYLTEMSGI
jgi:hypothetical protein